MRRLFVSLSLVILSASHLFAATNCVVISSDTIWSGDVAVTEDLLIQEGATLTILPGTKITVSKSESTKTEPEYLSSLTEITVRGVLRAVGSETAPISFVFDRGRTAAMPSGGVSKDWAGIMVDGGVLEMAWVQVSGAESGVTAIAGDISVRDSTLSGNRHGISIINSDAKVVLERDSIEANDYGLALLNGATITKRDCLVRNNDHKDILRSESGVTPPVQKLYQLPEPERKSVYTNESLLSTVIWKDKVVVKGVVRVPAKSKLIIMPGTIVEFSKRDTNGDDIGENGLLVMGVLIAKGTSDRPIIFRSAEVNKHPGDWDAVNIFSSDGAENLIEYCQFENAYRALHFHFSNVSVTHSVLHDNYRALQFQESLIRVIDNDIYNNKSAIRARDSEVVIAHNRIVNNYTGPNIFRVTGEVRGNRIVGNYLDGIRIREGSLEVEENFIGGNRYGLTVAYANFGKYSNNVISQNLETGLTIKGTDSVAVGNNFVQGNGGNGISLLNSRAVIKGNQISGNGERGIGIVSFSGVISANNLLDNKLYAIGLDGADDVTAPGNYYGGDDLAAVIYDKNDDPEKGLLHYEEPSTAAIPFVWPLEQVFSDTLWEGEIQIPRKVAVPAGVVLMIAPGSTIKFGRKRGLWVRGRLEAVGRPDTRITFTGLEEADNYWHQVMIEEATANFVNCDFAGANMGVHSQYSKVTISNCSFRKNETGLKLKGGELEIKDSLFKDNIFGIVPNRSKVTISENLVYNNKIGILVREEKDGGITVRHNNIFANSRYNIRMGSLNGGDGLDARNNWWGTDTPGETIFDERQEPGIGKVSFTPFLGQEITGIAQFNQ